MALFFVKYLDIPANNKRIIAKISFDKSKNNLTAKAMLCNGGASH